MTNFIDLAFPIKGTVLNADHNYFLYSAIAKRLNESRVKTSRGGRWYAKTVSNIINREHEFLSKNGGFL
ncbi:MULTISPECIES: recombinase family protein [unclassified Synechocystis]|nr:MULTISPECIES: recombinase family protein [unclassified Synechocystis]